MPLENVREAFVERSKMMVASEFVEAYLRETHSPIQECLDLVWLMENVTGGANKRQAIRWLLATVSSLRFEGQMLSNASSPSARMLHVAELYREAAHASVGVSGSNQLLARLAELGGRIEAESKMVSLIAKSAASPAQKVTALVRMATGETAPPGPAADRAKASVLKLATDPEVRAALAEDAESMRRLRQLVASLASAA